MALKARFNMRDIDKVFKEAEKQHIEKMIRVLKYVGEEAVNHAKNNGIYNNWTSNLRNSIGYVIAVKGKVTNEHFEAKHKGTVPSKEKGEKIGKKLAKEIAKTTDELALIVVAGMKYAVFVEAIKGKVVLTSAEQYAKQVLPRLLSQLK